MIKDYRYRAQSLTSDEIFEGYLISSVEIRVYEDHDEAELEDAYTDHLIDPATITKI